MSIYIEAPEDWDESQSNKSSIKNFFDDIFGTNNSTSTSSSFSESVSASESSSSTSQFDQPSSVIESDIPVENAFRAAVVAITNGYANDVFTDDGDYYDPLKLHSYSDLSGFHFVVKNKGTWTVKSSNTLHVEGLRMEASIFANKVNASLDVTFDGTNYVISNLGGMYGNNELYLLESEPDSFKNNYLVVKPELIADDR